MLLSWTLWTAIASASPISVHMAVPRVAAVPVDGVAAMPSMGFSRREVDGQRMDLAVGRTVLWVTLASMPKHPCTCDHPALLCAIQDDGAIALRLNDPTFPRVEPDLGLCHVDELKLAVELVPAALPGAVEASDGRWVVPVDPDRPRSRPILHLPKARGWTAVEGGGCRLEAAPRRSARVIYDGIARRAAWLPCVAGPRGATIEVRPVPYVAPWTITPPAP